MSVSKQAPAPLLRRLEAAGQSHLLRFYDSLGPQSRQRLVDRAAQHWGADWFVLPNSSYGEWERLLGANPVERLRPTQMPPPAVAH